MSNEMLVSQFVDEIYSKIKETTYYKKRKDDFSIRVQPQRKVLFINKIIYFRFDEKTRRVIGPNLLDQDMFKRLMKTNSSSLIRKAIKELDDFFDDIYVILGNYGAKRLKPLKILFLQYVFDDVLTYLESIDDVVVTVRSGIGLNIYLKGIKKQVCLTLNPSKKNEYAISNNQYKLTFNTEMRNPEQLFSEYLNKLKNDLNTLTIKGLQLRNIYSSDEANSSLTRQLRSRSLKYFKKNTERKSEDELYEKIKSVVPGDINWTDLLNGREIFVRLCKNGVDYSLSCYECSKGYFYLFDSDTIIYKQEKKEIEEVLNSLRF